MNYQLITTDEQLALICERASQVTQVALDTEFVRTRTYYPQLGLIQLFDGQQVSLIDPLTISDWAPFRALLINPNVMKLLHACSEDLDVFLHEFGVLPQPLMDTQVLAAFNQHPLSSGFASLAMEYLNVELDKSESRTDWLARPLSEKQMNYAAADVFYLLPIAAILLSKTEQGGWLTAAISECEAIAKRRAEMLDPDCAYTEINHAWQLNNRQLACLKVLAAWRLRYARERDKALNFVVREDHLWKVAQQMPTTLAELETLGVSGPEIRYHGRTLLALVATAREIPEADLPEKLVRVIDCLGYKRLFKEIKSLVQTVAQERGLNAELLASRRQINQFLKHYWRLNYASDAPELITGWRGALLALRLQCLLTQETAETVQS